MVVRLSMGYDRCRKKEELKGMGGDAVDGETQTKQRQGSEQE
jgi:hypothetical protein